MHVPAALAPLPPGTRLGVWSSDAGPYVVPALALLLILEDQEDARYAAAEPEVRVVTARGEAWRLDAVADPWTREPCVVRLLLDPAEPFPADMDRALLADAEALARREARQESEL